MMTDLAIADSLARQRRAKVERGRYLTRQERSCVFKRRHVERTALAEARRLQQLGEDRATAYLCACGWWHVGKRKQDG